jgi:hypothetical protein
MIFLGAFEDIFVWPSAALKTAMMSQTWLLGEKQVSSVNQTRITSVNLICSSSIPVLVIGHKGMLPAWSHFEKRTSYQKTGHASIAIGVDFRSSFSSIS